jgi:hypothetical protein
MHHLLVEFFNTLKVNDNKLKMFARTQYKVCVIDKFILGKNNRDFYYGIKQRKIGKKKFKFFL